ncbi:hypothetical protein Q3G72_020854 [Acer saccharum]|nr:hypothetical protein Q3G72_020854 [Acer saccharum]
MMKQGVQAEMTSNGVLVNSFDELEPPYAEHYRKSNKATPVNQIKNPNPSHLSPSTTMEMDEEKTRRKTEAPKLQTSRYDDPSNPFYLHHWDQPYGFTTT